MSFRLVPLFTAVALLAGRRDEYVIFLELCKEELFALVERKSTLSEKECKHYMSQLLSAVNHIHR